MPIYRTLLLKFRFKPPLTLDPLLLAATDTSGPAGQRPLPPPANRGAPRGKPAPHFPADSRGPPKPAAGPRGPRVPAAARVPCA